MRRPEWVGCTLVGGGVAVFVICSPQSAGRSDAPPRDWLIAFSAVALISTGAGAAAYVGRRAMRASLLAIAAGVIFGMTAAVTLSMTRIIRFGAGAGVLTHWQPWALLGLGISGMLVAATAYRAGALRASLPIMDAVEPLSGVLIGAAVFGERLATSPGMLVVQAAAATGAVVGITLLGRSSLAAAPATDPAGGSAFPAFSSTRSHV